MFRNLRTLENIVFEQVIQKQNVIGQRTMKNFGHKRVPVPAVTTIWHGFLTLSFIGTLVEWKWIKKFLFGDSEELNQDIDPISQPQYKKSSHIL